MRMILLTSGMVLLITTTSYFVYELLDFRQSAIRALRTIGEITAANSGVALATNNPDVAYATLSALNADSHIVAAALYRADGTPLVIYPKSLEHGGVPERPAAPGYRFEVTHLVGIQPIVADGKRLGTLFLKSDVKAIDEWLRVYGFITLLVTAIAAVMAYAISRVLQRQISQPISALTQTAQAVIARRDYSIRVPPYRSADLEVLADTFNHMLEQIQSQHIAMERSALRVRAVLDCALSAVVVIDANGKIVDWNTAAEKIFGWKRDEALGREISETIIPLRFRQAHLQGLARLANGGEGRVLNKVIEMSALRRDGTEFPVELSISPLRSRGSFTYCGFITDITERKHADTRLKTQLSRLNLMQHITHAIGERQDLQSIFHVLLRNLEDNLPIDFGCVLLYDEAVDTLTASTIGPRSSFYARDLEIQEQTQIPIDRNGLASCVRGEVVCEQDLRVADFPFPQRLARAGLCSLAITPLAVENKVFGVLVAAQRESNAFSSADCEFLKHLSEHVALAAHQAQLHSALQRAYDDLRQSHQSLMQQERLKALGEMASGIAHDINNAISPVSLYTETLLEREPNLSERARNYLKIIQTAIEDVAATVGRMREFYRPREAQMELGRVDLNRIVEQVLDLTRARWTDQPHQQGVVIDVRKDLTADLPRISGAESELRDALTNLVLNAVDAMPEGGTLSVRTGTRDDRVFVEVGDSGIGMDEETRRRCIEPFYTTKGERGTGLGLAMVYGTIQRHSADLEIDSELGRGTTMRMLFLAREEAVASRVQSQVTSARPPRLRILLVDDDPLLIRSLQDTLEADGHSITIARGGQAGIDTFAAALNAGQPFSLVMTDLGMPHVDGRKVAAAVKSASAHTPVILLTGWGQRLAAQNDIPPHVNRVISKPPKLHDLRMALSELTANEPAQHDLADAGR
jgi:PAS domain S-box-containing protein